MSYFNRFRAFKVAVFLATSCILLAISGFGLWQWKMQQPLNIPSQGMILDVESGQSLSHIGNQLQSLNVIDSSWWIRLYARLHPRSVVVLAGEYRLEPGMTLPQVMAMLMAGQIIEYPIKFLEGWTFSDVRKELQKHPKLQSLSADENNEQLMISLGRPNEFPEGLFFPDTYFYHKGMSDLDVLRMALRRMDQILVEEWQARAADLPYQSPYQALIMASIVEKETGAGFEREKIAGVFVRRLQLGMRLQTDPTVIYGLGDAYQGNLTKRDLMADSPYNTYRISGLPPTPIALPGRDAIHAALHPDPGKSLYFVARGDGTHAFSETLEQHQKAVMQYQVLNRRSDYRSAPTPQNTQ